MSTKQLTMLIDKLKTELVLAKDSIKSLQDNCSSLQDYIVHQDAYFRRDNLLFGKIPESKDCVKVMRKLFVEELKTDTHRASDIKIIRCQIDAPMNILTKMNTHSSGF